jgi:DNA invertase Pin-like site-specific DNA recombinase
MDGPTRNRIRAELIEAAKHVDAGREQRDRLVHQGAAAGIGKTELAELAGVSRQTVYDILAKEAQS